MLCGCILGGFVPIVVFFTSHSKAIQEATSIQQILMDYSYLMILIIGGLAFSATSVYRWAYQAFGNSWVKAAGFVVLVEGTLTLSPNPYLAWAALVYLVIINAIATGTTLALAQGEHNKAKYQETRQVHPQLPAHSPLPNSLEASQIRLKHVTQQKTRSIPTKTAKAKTTA